MPYTVFPAIGINIANCIGPRERAVLEANSYKPRRGKENDGHLYRGGLKNEDLPVMGDGEQSSDFVFIEDVVEAIMRAPGPAAIGQIMDIGTGINTSVKKVAEMIIEITGSKSKIKYVPLRTGEVKVHTKADNTNAKKVPRLGTEN